MHSRTRILAAALAACIASVNPPSLHAAQVGSTFTYQGELRTSGVPSEGLHDFQVALYAQAEGGTPIDTLDFDDATVSGGLFSLPLDFTSVPFESGEQYWLQLSVRDGASGGGFTSLLPRQPITAAPYALHAVTVSPGSVGSIAIDSTQVQRRVATGCPPDQSIREINEDGSVTCEVDSGATQPLINSVSMSYEGSLGTYSEREYVAQCFGGERVAISGGVDTGCPGAIVQRSSPDIGGGWSVKVVKPADVVCAAFVTMTIAITCVRLP